MARVRFPSGAAARGLVVAGRFHLEDAATSGGLATVYRAMDRATGQSVAVKVLDTDDAEHVVRFGREAELLASLQHPGVVRYVAHGSLDDGTPYLATEWLDGETLARRFERRAFSVGESIAFGIRLAGALDAIHRAGVVHRDLTPSNVLLRHGRPDDAVLVDFGLARPKAGSRITETGALLGTPGYMAPEQVRGEAEVDARADLFALGCVLFRCLTGRDAFEGDDMLGILARVVLEEPPRMSQVKPVPPLLDEIVWLLLAKDPRERPASAADVASALGAMASREETEGLPPSSTRALTRAERRLVCLVLARVSAIAIDEQRVQRLRDAAHRYHGRLDVLADGAVAIAFGTTDPLADIAVRAARCALAVASLEPESSIAIVSDRRVASERQTVSETIDRALALLSLVVEERPVPRPRAAAIAVDDVMSRLLDVHFEVHPAEMGGWLAAERRADEQARTVLGRRTECLGRDRELALLEDVFEHCTQEPSARAALLVGSPGIGKSRLAGELVRRIGARAEVWLAKADRIGPGSPFGLVGGLLRCAAGIHEDDSADARVRALGARAARVMPAADAQRVAPFLAEIVGVSAEREARVPLAAARRDLQVMGDQMRLAWMDFVLAETTAHPVVLLLDDVHWGDLASLTLVDAALRACGPRPLFVLGVARPTVRDRFPDLWAERAVTTMTVGELPRRASEQLIRDVLGADIAPSRAALLATRARGNPFFLEELIRAEAEGRADTLPETLVETVEARLGTLDPSARRVLRAASVFGEVFWEAGVEALVGGDTARHEVKRQLALLVDDEIIVRRRDRRSQGEDEYAFAHTLLRDGAYATLADDDRALGHRLAGDWFVSTHSGDPLAVAEHFERGGQPARAVEGYARAAEQALEGNDLEGVLSRAGRGIACGAEGTTLGKLYRLQATAHAWRAEYAEAQRDGQLALAHLDPGSTQWFDACADAAASSAKLGDVARLAAMAAELRDAPGSEEARDARWTALARTALYLVHHGQGRAADDLLARITQVAGDAERAGPAAAAWIARVHALAALVAGDPAGFLAHCAAAVAWSEEAGDVRQGSITRVNVGFAALELGDYPRAEATLRQALELADRIGLPSAAASAEHVLGLALAYLGRLPEAEEVERRALAAFVTQRDRRMQSGCHRYLARILELAGDADGAEREAHAAVESAADLPPVRACALATLAHVLLARNRAAEAVAIASEAATVLASLGGIEEGDALVRLTYARMLHAAGDAAAARAAIGAARDRLLLRAGRIGDETLRLSFLTNVPEHHETMLLATAWLGTPFRAAGCT